MVHVSHPKQNLYMHTMTDTPHWSKETFSCVISARLQKCEEMVEILDHLHQYVPTVSREVTVTLPDSADTIQAYEDTFDPVILGMR